ncbi:hypothetical protein KR084_004228 [Drosophila pseudotakahashii]|nr:hypothetical protein KR084_004228 [Drosophila pseudotakahashii]
MQLPIPQNQFYPGLVAGPWPPDTVAATTAHGQNFYEIGGNIFTTNPLAPQAVAAGFAQAPPPTAQTMLHGSSPSNPHQQQHLMSSSSGSNVQSGGGSDGGGASLQLALHKKQKTA